ncbi:MAG: phosphoribosyltransferase family protein [Rikenellaceae bacterium]
MSTLSNMFHDLLALLCPAQCIGCGTLLEGRAEWICIRCRAEIPLTYFHFDPENPMARKVKAICPSIENATAQFFYVNKGRWREVIHEIKYRRSWYTAFKIGYWYGFELQESDMFADVDLLMPVPLHRSRMLRRRYNQSEQIADGLAKALGLKVNRTALKRRSNNPSQVTRTKQQRWRNVQGIFAVRHAEQLAGKHILLVDDVFTTGATIISCAETIKAAVPDCRISVATIAASRNEVLGRMI